MSDLPEGWIQKESRSHAGRIYYFNQSTQETQWEKPTHGTSERKVNQVQVLHILKKHKNSRRPSSWRVPNITQTKEEALSQIVQFQEILLEKLGTEGFEAMHNLFRSIASTESDCGSAQNGGDLGLFGRGQMQRSFEDASFSLPVGGLSQPVDTDSGIHIILRIQ